MRQLAGRRPVLATAVICTVRANLTASDVLGRGHVDGDAAALCGRSVLVATQSQAAAALALLSLDGVARRMVVVPPGLGAADVHRVARLAEVDAVVCEPGVSQPALSAWPSLAVDFRGHSQPLRAARECTTEWVLLTSGTTGTPKLVVHTLETLTGAINPHAGPPPAAWATFYDIRRYGGLQIFLRAILLGGSLVLPDPDEGVDQFLSRAEVIGLDYLSGTPSHWRRALLGRALAQLKLRNVRLSGEIADQAILDRLKGCFTSAKIVHAFASTEAGVAFEVADGREGFPEALLHETGTSVELKIEKGTLRIRSPRIAVRVLDTTAPVADADGFVDTHDFVESREGRCYFGGRSDGVINSGGNKVHPEEIESLLNRHPRVLMSRARARRNPILGAIIEVDVVVRDAGADNAGVLEDELLRFCGAVLPPHKRPTAICVVPSLSLSTAGKLERRSA